MTSGELQMQLFRAINSKTGENVILANEIAELLDISTDSAYRRIRGEKTIALDELYSLCKHYRISLDTLLNVQADAFVFEGRILDATNFRFEEYLKTVVQQMEYMNTFKKKEFIYLCKDSPFFHHYYIREFAAFKYYFWMSTIFFFPEFRHKKIDIDEYPEELFSLGQKALDLYEKLDSVEIWNIENLNGTLRQLDYYQSGGVFKSTGDILKIYEAIEKTMQHVEKQAALGYKFKYGDPEQKPLGKFRMYFNEVVLGDNQMLVLLDDFKIAYIPHSVANFMITRDEYFCDKFHQYLQNLMKRSTLISEVSEKERARFFRIIRERIERRKETLKL
jgi:hypothetical protein